MTEQLELTEEEIRMIRSHRDIKGREQKRRDKRIECLETAIKFAAWLHSNNNKDDSYSVFVGEFGYLGDDPKEMYSVVVHAILSVDQLAIPYSNAI